MSESRDIAACPHGNNAQHTIFSRAPAMTSQKQTQAYIYIYATAASTTPNINHRSHNRTQRCHFNTKIQTAVLSRRGQSRQGSMVGRSGKTYAWLSSGLVFNPYRILFRLELQQWRTACMYRPSQCAVCLLFTIFGTIHSLPQIQCFSGKPMNWPFHCIVVVSVDDFS